MNKLLSFKLNGYNLAVPVDQIEKILINKRPTRSEFTLSTGVEVKNLADYIPLKGSESPNYENIIFVKDQVDYYGFTVEKILGYLTLTEKFIPKKGRAILSYVRYEERLIPVLDLKGITNGEVEVTDQDIEEIESFSEKENISENESETEEEGIYEVSKEEVYRAIEEEINKQKKEIISDIKIQSEKKGFILPLIVNIVIVVVVTAGILYYVLVANRGAFTVIRTGAVGGVEEEVIKEIKRRSQEKIEAQKKKLAEAKKRLISLEKEKEYFLKNQDKILSEKEKRLREEYEKKLAEARKRIEESGVKDVESEYQKEKQKIYEEFLRNKREIQLQVEEAKKKFEEELKRKEASLKQEVDRYNRQISEMEQRLIEQKQQLEQAQKKVQNIEAEQQAYLTFRRQLNNLYNKALTNFYYKKYKDGINVLKNMLPIIDKAQRGNIGDRNELNIEKKLVNNLIEMAGAEKNNIDFKKMIKSTYVTAKLLQRSGKYEEAMMKYFTVYTLTNDSNLRRVSLMNAKSLMEEIFNKLNENKRKMIEQNAKIILQDAIQLKKVGEYDGALKKLNQVITMFAGIDITKQALNEIEDINNRKLKQLEAERLEIINKKAKEIFSKAERAYKEGFISEAFNGYEEILRDYRESTYADIALKKIKKINNEMKNLKVSKNVNLIGKFENSGVVIQRITDTLLLVSLGTDNGVKKGDVFQIVRKEGDKVNFIGNLKIVEVFSNTSKGRLMYYEKIPAIGDLVVF